MVTIHSKCVVPPLPRVSHPDSSTEQFHDSDCSQAEGSHSVYVQLWQEVSIILYKFWEDFHAPLTLPCVRTNITGMETGSKVWGESQHDMGYILYWNYLKQIGKILVHRLYCTGKQIYAVLVNRICWDICPKWLSLDVSLIKTKKFLY